jgi:thiol-disulfide isomerase/thioredoxin
MKYALILIWLAIIFSGIFYIFWQNELKYNLPTPVPTKYHGVSTGTYINTQGKLAASPGKPVFIHFFNPDCPCSRFNMPHFKSLVKQYGNKISFAVVVLAEDKDYTPRDIQDRFDLEIPVLFDSSLAADCGVYATPQAVLLDAQHNLYYRGNYNKSRYCTNKESNYAQMAIDTLLNHNSMPVFNAYALTAYGCVLPACNK